jgi:hypothetical protein
MRYWITRHAPCSHRRILDALRIIPLPKYQTVWHNPNMPIERLWCFRNDDRFPAFVIIDSKKIDGAAFDRANEILEAGGITDDFTPMIFLDGKLDSPEVREQTQADSIKILRRDA